jgi:hypothetical protein
MAVCDRNLAERLRGVGNSSGDENGRDSMKYWEIIADRLHAQGWSYGIAEHLTKQGLLFLRRCTPRWKTIHR